MNLTLPQSQLHSSVISPFEFLFGIHGWDKMEFILGEDHGTD